MVYFILRINEEIILIQRRHRGTQYSHHEEQKYRPARCMDKAFGQKNTSKAQKHLQKIYQHLSTSSNGNVITTKQIFYYLDNLKPLLSIICSISSMLFI